MVYRVLAEAAMVAHFAFLAFLVGGGFLAWRWPRLFWPHAATVGWGFAAVIAGLGCPLTSVESWGRRMAGGTGLPDGFIDTYIEGVLYPEPLEAVVRWAVLAAVVASWLPLLRARRNRSGTRPSARGRPA